VERMPWKVTALELQHLGPQVVEKVLQLVHL